jgi:hypothetical protein
MLSAFFDIVRMRVSDFAVAKPIPRGLLFVLAFFDDWCHHRPCGSETPGYKGVGEKLHSLRHRVLLPSASPS